MKFDSDYVMTINGQAVTTEHTQPVYNPANRSVFAQVPDASRAQLDEAVGAARQAFGGHKQSGLGCENSLHGLMEYTNWQTITKNKSAG